MEIEVSLQRWNGAIQSMEDCVRKLLNQEKRLEEVYQTMGRTLDSGTMAEVLEVIRKQDEVMGIQVRRLSTMELVLEKVKQLYQNCEENVVDSGEVNRKQYPENLSVINLDNWKTMSVLLK